MRFSVSALNNKTCRKTKTKLTILKNYKKLWHCQANKKVIKIIWLGSQHLMQLELLAFLFVLLFFCCSLIGLNALSYCASDFDFHFSAKFTLVNLFAADSLILISLVILFDFHIRWSAKHTSPVSNLISYWNLWLQSANNLSETNNLQSNRMKLTAGCDIFFSTRVSQYWLHAL